jgi:hypothetical protein
VAVIILNKDAEQSVEVRLNFGSGRAGAVETKTLHAPALDSREAHITRSPEPGRLQDGKYTVTVPHTTGGDDSRILLISSRDRCAEIRS